MQNVTGRPPLLCPLLIDFPLWAQVSLWTEGGGWWWWEIQSSQEQHGSKYLPGPSRSPRPVRRPALHFTITALRTLQSTASKAALPQRRGWDGRGRRGVYQQTWQPEERGFPSRLVLSRHWGAACPGGRSGLCPRGGCSPALSRGCLTLRTRVIQATCELPSSNPPSGALPTLPGFPRGSTAPAPETGQSLVLAGRAGSRPSSRARAGAQAEETPRGSSEFLGRLVQMSVSEWRSGAAVRSGCSRGRQLWSTAGFRRRELSGVPQARSLGTSRASEPTETCLGQRRGLWRVNGSNARCQTSFFSPLFSQGSSPRGWGPQSGGIRRGLGSGAVALEGRFGWRLSGDPWRCSGHRLSSQRQPQQFWAAAVLKRVVSLCWWRSRWDTEPKACVVRPPSRQPPVEERLGACVSFDGVNVYFGTSLGHTMTRRRGKGFILEVPIHI